MEIFSARLLNLLVERTMKTFLFCAVPRFISSKSTNCIHTWRLPVRSELVTQAVVPVRNRFLLVHVASVITRKFHRPTKDRLAESINKSLAGLGEGKYLLRSGAGPMWAIRAAADMDTIAAFTSLTTGIPYFPATEDEPTPDERMAVSVALLNAPEMAETA
jgi:hypothetical protein